MNKLQAEAFILIISNLDFTTKLQCILVCKKWHELISSSNLYESLSFGKYSSSLDCTTQFKKALALLKKQQTEQKTGKQVKSLDVNHCGFNKDLLLSLPQMFPNLKHFTWKEESSLEEDFNNDSASEFAEWVQLECLVLHSFSNLATVMLGLAVWRCLTELDVEFLSFYLKEETVSIETMLPGIAGLPALKVLKLKYISIDLEDMQKIHTLVPSLEVIQLSSTEFVDTPSASLIEEEEKILLLDVSGRSAFIQDQAIKLKDVSVCLDGDYNDNFFNNLSKSIVYIGHKYPYIENLIVQPSPDHIARNSRLEESIIKSLVNMPHLQHYGMGFASATANIVEAMHDQASSWI